MYLTVSDALRSIFHISKVLVVSCPIMNIAASCSSPATEQLDSFPIEYSSKTAKSAARWRLSEIREVSTDTFPSFSVVLADFEKSSF